METAVITVTLIVSILQVSVGYGNLCPTGYHYSSGQCVKSEYYQSEKGSNEEIDPTCPKGFSFNADGKCSKDGRRKMLIEIDPECPNGFVLNKKIKCIPKSRNTPEFTENNDRNLCPHGYFLDDDGSCTEVPEVEAKCPRYYVFNENGKCVSKYPFETDSQCPQGFSKDEEGKCTSDDNRRSLREVDAICPKSYTMNEEGKCVTDGRLNEIDPNCPSKYRLQGRKCILNTRASNVDTKEDNFHRSPPNLTRRNMEMDDDISTFNYSAKSYPQLEHRSKNSKRKKCRDGDLLNRLGLCQKLRGRNNSNRCPHGYKKDRKGQCKPSYGSKFYLQHC